MTELPADWFNRPLADVDPEVAEVLRGELERQQRTLEMIASANAEAYFALLEPGDTILGLDLAHGGHLTHGMAKNVSGRLYNVVPYHVRREDSLVDMDEVAQLAAEHKPKLIIAGWSAYPRQLDFAHFRAIADDVGAVLLTDMAHFAGPVAAGLHP